MQTDLQKLALESLVEGFYPPNKSIAAALRVVMTPPARRVVEVVEAFDQSVRQHRSLQPASAWLVDRWCRSVTYTGCERIPLDRPLLIVSNHPGVLDAMAILAALPGRDVRVIAKTRAILNHLTEVKRYLISVPDDDHLRISPMRAALRHLQTGGVLLTFPYGAIEPDPLHYPALAVKSLKGWSSSIEFLVRHVSDLAVLPVLVSGVISTSALRHPVPSLYRTRERRDYCAATLQFISRRYRDNHIRVTFGEPLLDGGLTAVREGMHDLIEQGLRLP